MVIPPKFVHCTFLELEYVVLAIFIILITACSRPSKDETAKNLPL